MTLPPGPKLTAPEFIARLRERGVRLALDDRGNVVVTGVVTAADHAAIRREKGGIRAALRAELASCR